MQREVIKSKSIIETQTVAKKVAQQLKPGDVLGLIGPLGSGKTTFVQGLALGLGLKKGEVVSSPTYAFIQEYACDVAPLYHIDFYRLKNKADALSLGLDDYFFGRGICAVEWFDQIDLSIRPSVKCEMKWLSEFEREIQISY